MSSRANRKRRSRGPSLTEHLDLKPGDRITLRLGPLNDAGDATAHLDGAPVEVAGGLPGEDVIAEVIRAFPERVAAKVALAASPSPDRVAPPCPYYLQCTGCQLQHMRYEAQLEFKRGRLAAELAKWPALAGATVLPTLASPRQLGYRNHARFSVGKGNDVASGTGRGDVGYVNAVTRRLVRVDRCLLMDDRVNAALAAMQGRLAGMSQLSVRVGSAVEDGAQAGTESEHPFGSYLIQPELVSPDVPFPSGQTHYQEEALGRRFRVAGSSFFQVNTQQLENVVGLLKNRLGLTGAETVVDAYCGVGTFAVLLAPYARRVIGIEDSVTAVEDARANAKGLSNVEFVSGRSEDAMGRIEGGVDAVVLDPPRAGCHPGAIEAVKRLRPAQVALVSCEPSAMARDLDGLLKGPFSLASVQPVDMFPQTRHVEAVAFLRLSS
ncbi:MAG: class I SAM-dependent RNA methyltransferase [Dehalococcoidia bacterium]|nr:class I SAM-dependent RNA methyltransferase [Dehalococcoidia bacterium]MSQ35170.1 class I SAM-dependent RNA methyltransferase [Dehalococcoidia bacterium]